MHDIPALRLEPREPQDIAQEFIINSNFRIDVVAAARKHPTTPGNTSGKVAAKREATGKSTKPIIEGITKDAIRRAGIFLTPSIVCTKE